MPGKHASPAERFERQTIPEPNSGCLLWTGAVNESGYGQLSRDTVGNKISAHRLAWILRRGSIPAGMAVCHKCDVPSCVNADHLFLGTLGDNARDREEKGRSAVQRGAANHAGSKLSDETAREIYFASGSQRQIARTFGVSQPVVCLIKNGRAWRHIHGGRV